MGQFGHCVCRCLNALTGQLSPYGNVIGWGSLCPLKRLIFSSAVSNGLSQQHTPLDSLLLHAIELIDLLTSYSIHRPSTCKPHSMRIDSTLKAPQSQLCHLFWNWLSQTVPVPIKKINMRMLYMSTVFSKDFEWIPSSSKWSNKPYLEPFWSRIQPFGLLENCLWKIRQTFLSFGLHTRSLQICCVFFCCFGEVMTFHINRKTALWQIESEKMWFEVTPSAIARTK